MKNVKRFLWTLQHMPRGFRTDDGHMWDLVVWKWYGTHVNKPNGEWNKVAEIMMINFAESGHAIFQATSPLGRGELKSKGGGKENHSLQRKWRNRWIDSSHGYFSQSAQYLRRAVADLRNEFDPDFAESEICEPLVIPTGSANATTTSHSSTPSTQGNFLQDYFKKYAELPEDQKLSKLCKDAGFSRKIEKRHFFITIEEGSEIMQTACREYTQPRNITTSPPRRWIRSNTIRAKIISNDFGPSLGCETLSSRRTFLHWSNHGLKDRTVSWVRIVNGINKYVTETSEEIPTENVELFINTGKLVAKAEPKPKSVVNSSINVLFRDRKWIDTVPQPFDHSCFEVSLRHDSSIPREEDGAARFDDLIEKLKEKCVSTLQWKVKTWVNSLAQGGGRKKMFQYCLNPCYSNKFLYFRAIQGHSGENFVDPLLQDTVLLPNDFADYIYHIGNAHDMHSIIQGSLKTDRQSVFFTAVNPMHAKIWKKSNTIWTNPESRCSKILGEFTNIQNIDAIWISLREKDCLSIKHDPTQSLFSTHYLRYVLRKWKTRRLERIETAT